MNNSKIDFFSDDENFLNNVENVENETIDIKQFEESQASQIRRESGQSAILFKIFRYYFQQ